MSTPFHVPVPRAIRLAPTDRMRPVVEPIRSPWPAPVAGAVIRSNAWAPPVACTADWAPPERYSVVTDETVTVKRRWFALRTAWAASLVAAACAIAIVTQL